METKFYDLKLALITSEWYVIVSEMNYENVASSVYVCPSKNNVLDNAATWRSCEMENGHDSCCYSTRAYVG
jgi:hypothetical protein